MGMINFRFTNLPIPPADYSPEHLRQAFRILELYFNQVDSLTPIQAEYFAGRGDRLTFPHIAASDSTDQYAAGNDTPTLVNWNTLTSGYGWILNSPGSATSEFPGFYKIAFCLQFANTANTAHDAIIWLRVNTVDVTNSATTFTLPARKTATVPSYLLANAEISFEIAAGDEIELYWATDQAATSGGVNGVYMLSDPAQTTPYVRPAIPSAVGSITFVSAVS